MAISSLATGAKLLSVNSASQMAQKLGIAWPPSPSISIRKLITLASISAPVPTTLLIICPADFASAGNLQALIDHKNQTGVPTTAVTLEGVLTSFDGRDDPERIKLAIYTAYLKRRIQYVMLVGDAQNFPVRFRFVKNAPGAAISNNGWFDGTYCPTDLYYAAFTDAHEIYDTWDANGNGKYDESTWSVSPYSDNPDAVTGWPSVSVGRVPANTAADVASYVTKVVTYEVNQTGIPDMITFVADNAYPSSDSLSSSVAQNSGITKNLASRSLWLMDGPAQPPGGWTSATAADIDNAVADSFWISYIGHGGGTVWGANSIYTTSQVSALRNADFPIIFAAACSTGQVTTTPPFGEYVDAQGVKHWFWFGPPYAAANIVIDRDSTPPRTWDFNVQGAPPIDVPTPSPLDYESGAQRTFAYWWLFNPSGGAIAYFGENIVMEDVAGTEFESYMLSEYTNGNRVLGSIWLTAQQTYWKNYIASPGNLDYNFAHPRIFLGVVMMYGDPSLRLR